MSKLEKYLKLVLQKLGTLQFPGPNGLGFQVQKLIMTNLKVGKKIFSISLLGLFSPESPESMSLTPVRLAKTIPIESDLC